MLFFSPSTGGFYDSRVASPPADAVEITEAERDAALSALEPGTAIVAGPDGKPLVAARTVDIETATQRMREKRDRLLRASDATQLPDFPMEAAERAAWASYRQALRGLPASITDFDQVDWPTPPQQ